MQRLLFVCAADIIVYDELRLSSSSSHYSSAVQTDHIWALINYYRILLANYNISILADITWCRWQMIHDSMTVQEHLHTRHGNKSSVEHLLKCILIIIYSGTTHHLLSCWSHQTNHQAHALRNSLKALLTMLSRVRMHSPSMYDFRQ